MIQLLAAIALIALSLPCAAAQDQEPRFAVHDLGAVEEGASFARAVSSNGKAAGYVFFSIHGQYRPAMFEPGQLPTAIYTDGPGAATGINAAGEVVGWYLQGDLQQAFRWKHNVLEVLPTLLGGETVAAAINDSSEIVGWSLGLEPYGLHAVHYRNGKLTDLGTWGGVSARATAINSKGDIVGFREVRTEAGSVVREGVHRSRNGRIDLLPRLPGFDNLVPMAINDKGDVAGYAYPSGARSLDDHVAFSWVGKKMTQLTAGSCCYGTQALGVNNSRQVVGFSFDGAADPRNRGRLWARDEIIRLDSLPEIFEAGWWALGEANAINDDGVVVGTGQRALPTRQIRAFMLIPSRQ